MKPGKGLVGMRGRQEWEWVGGDNQNTLYTYEVFKEQT